MKEPVSCNILYSCSAKQHRGHEQFVAEHTLGLIISGETHFFINNNALVCKEGSIGLARKNQLLKSVKFPPPNGEFKSISILLAEPILREFSKEHNITLPETILLKYRLWKCLLMILF